MILDAITSSPLNVFITIVLGFGLAYLICRKPSSSSSSSSSQSSSSSSFYSSSRGIHSVTNHSFAGGIVDDELQRTIAQIERQERDMIRREQDEAYRNSLKADKEKQLKREKELRDKDAQEKAEKDRVAKLEELHNRLMILKKEILNKIPAQPEEDNQDEVVKLLFKLPDGTRVPRIFRAQDKVKYLYWFVFSIANAPLQFRMATNFPKRDLPGRPPLPEDFDKFVSCHADSYEPDCELTLQEASLTNNQLIFVYDLDA